MLTIPDSFRVLKVNHEKVKQPFLINETKLIFSPGQQIIELQYVELFIDDYDDDHTRVSSEPFVISFNLSEESKLAFIFPVIDTLNEARQYAKAPTINIHNEYGMPLSLIHTLLSEELQIAQQVEFQQGQQIITAEENKQKMMTAKVDSENIEPIAYDMLEYWWLKASEKDKRRFNDFLVKQKENQ